MNAKHIPILAILLISTLFVTAQPNDENSNFAIGFSTGYNRGIGVQLNITALNPSQSLPIQIRFGVGMTKLNPGSAADARRIFINNATNGVPEEKARSFDYRLDFLVDSDLIKTDNFQLGFGPRFSSFKANFKYVGGNEDFDVTSKQFGLGLGGESQFLINSKLNLLVAVGLDYFFNNTLKGHDTFYSPDDDNVNPRQDNTNDNIDFTFSDANEAIKQPNFMPRVLIGLVYKM